MERKMRSGIKSYYNVQMVQDDSALLNAKSGFCFIYILNMIKKNNVRSLTGFDSNLVRS